MPLKYAIRYVGEFRNLLPLDLVINIHSGAPRVQSQESGCVLTHVERGDGVFLCVFGAAVFRLVPFSFFGVPVLGPGTFPGRHSQCVLDSGYLW